MSKSAWVASSNAGDLWVVTRRACAPVGQVAVGVRGEGRGDRWAAFAEVAGVKERLRPSQLFACMASRTRMGLPALVALAWLELELGKSHQCELDWGPVGSVGFELATGRQVVTGSGDLDIALFAPTRFTREIARALWNVISATPAKVDVRIETPSGGFSLDEYAREGTEHVLVRRPACCQLAEDPWALRDVEASA